MYIQNSKIIPEIHFTGKNGKFKLFGRHEESVRFKILAKINMIEREMC